MLLSSFILIPLLTGLLVFAIKSPLLVKQVTLYSSVVLAGLVLFACTQPLSSHYLHHHAGWLASLNANFDLALDGPGKITTLLTAVSFPIIFLATWNNRYESSSSYYGLLALTQAGLMGVFLSTDALLFYFFWELALIPTYFLASKWGGENRVRISFKFFIYTFAGSLLMLIGIIYLYFHTPDQSFAWQSFKQVTLSPQAQLYCFLFFFIAFAIKMPVFPFHTWQPDLYATAPTGTTMVLSGIMVKMGLFAVLRWLLPVFPEMSAEASPYIIILCITGILYASLIALKQQDIKRLIAYSSIAHIGLMCAALFANNTYSYDGAVIQFFSHGINIIGLWIVVDYIEKHTGITKMNELGGLAKTAPTLAILLVIVALANVALPLTNAFVGEFLMFNGLFQANPWYAVLAGIAIILAAVYTLGMIQKMFYGEAVKGITIPDIKAAEAVALVSVLVLIIAFGVYPKPMLEMGAEVWSSTKSAMAIVK